MIPDKMIYREEDGKPFYVVANKETIYDALSEQQTALGDRPTPCEFICGVAGSMRAGGQPTNRRSAWRSSRRAATRWTS